ncbi:hypothetical protein BDR07DRAFT_1488233 [Suillus spraguei]|nr:hypothetical protein BDR07DRAFT_1488233 [Suillus spraguei]
MGITELWKLVSPSTEGQTLTVFALEGLKGHMQDQSGLSLMTVGIDASAWLYAICKLQAFRLGHAKSGENPELWMLMYKLVALANAPIHAHFIFDGRTTLQSSAMSMCGQGISAVLTEDSDTLLFGAEKVLRLMDNEDGMFIVDAYCAGALSNDPKIPLTMSHLLLWAMLRGGDYNPGGLSGCSSQLPDMLKTWRDCLRTVLVDGTLGRKYPALAASIPADFPSVEIMDLYLHPVTTWSDGASSSLLPQLSPTQPSLTHLAAFCHTRLGWTRSKIHKYFRNHFWSAACMWALCQLQANDGGMLPRPTFISTNERTLRGVYRYAASQYLCCQGESWVPSHSKVTIPAGIMELTSPQDVIDYSDEHTASAGPSSGDPLPDWHPHLSAQYAAVADMLWPEVEDMSSKVGDPELSGGMKMCTDEEGREVIDLTVD